MGKYLILMKSIDGYHEGNNGLSYEYHCILLHFNEPWREHDRFLIVKVNNSRG